MYHETAARLDIEVLDKLCVYLNCRLDELLEHVPTAAISAD